MITPASSDRGEQDHGFQIAPMVDVVFVLLLFFMALAGLRQIEHRIPADLPAPGSGDAPLVIDITSAGAVHCNGLELLSAGETMSTKLDAWLKNLAAAEPGTSILLRPAADTQHESFIRVLTSLHQAGLKKITFA